LASRLQVLGRSAYRAIGNRVWWHLKTIYIGLPGLKLAPDLAVDDDPKSRTHGWLFAKHPGGQWVTLADLKGLVPDPVNHARYQWAANELLACDYGDNDAPGEVVGWHVFGWRYRNGIQHRIYGSSIDAAIDAELKRLSASRHSPTTDRTP